MKKEKIVEPSIGFGVGAAAVNVNVSMNRSSSQCTCLSLPKLSKSRSEGNLLRSPAKSSKLKPGFGFHFDMRTSMCTARCLSGASHRQPRNHVDAAQTLLESADGDWTNTSDGSTVWRARHPSPPDSGDDLLAEPEPEQDPSSARSCTCNSSSYSLKREVRSLALRRFLETNSTATSMSGVGVGSALSGPAAVSKAGVRPRTRTSSGSERQLMEDGCAEVTAGCEARASFRAPPVYDNVRYGSTEATATIAAAGPRSLHSDELFTCRSATNLHASYSGSGMSCDERPALSGYGLSSCSRAPMTSYSFGSLSSRLPEASNVEHLASGGHDDSSPDSDVLRALTNRKQQPIQQHKFTF